MAKIRRKDLLDAVEIVKCGLASKELIDQSTSLIFSSGEVITYNDEVLVRHPVDLNIEGVLGAEELNSVLSRIEEDEIRVDVFETELRIETNRFKASISIEPEIRLPMEILDLGVGDLEWKRLPEDFIQGISFVYPIAARDLVIPVLSCVHVENNCIESSDGYRIARYEMKEEISDEFLFSASVCKDLSRFSFQEYSVSKSWVHFKSDLGIVFSTRLFDAKFPTIDDKINIEGVRISLPKKIEKILDRASIFAKRDNQIDEEVLVRIEKNRFLIKSQGERGWSEEEAVIKYKGPTISFSINPNFLRSVLFSRRCNIGDKAIKFQGENWRFLVTLRKVKD